MPTIDVTGAGARMLARRVNTPAHCLEYVWDAISQGKYHYITGGAANAYATWLAIPPEKRHVGDRHPPKDMPTFWGIRTSTGNILGDVIISNGDPIPYTVATDYPTSGKIGTPTLAQRGVQIGRVYLGWAPSMGGYDLTSAAWAGGGATPIGGGSDMTTKELIQETGDPTGSVYFSVDRLTRYHIPNEAVLADYVYWLGQLAAAGDTGANPNKFMVKSAASFGAIVADQPFPVSGGGSGGSVVMPSDYFSDADAAKLQAAILAGVQAGDQAILAAVAGVDEATLATFGLQRIPSK